MNAEIGTCLRSFFSFLYCSEEVPSLEHELQKSRETAYLIFCQSGLAGRIGNVRSGHFSHSPSKKINTGVAFRHS